MGYYFIICMTVIWYNAKLETYRLFTMFKISLEIDCKTLLIFEDCYENYVKMRNFSWKLRWEVLLAPSIDNQVKESKAQNIIGGMKHSN